MREATKAETAIIERILKDTARIRRAAELREKRFQRLVEKIDGDTVIAKVQVGRVTETRVLKVDKPKGKYVVYSPLDFTVNRHVTKKDLAELRDAAP